MKKLLLIPAILFSLGLFAQKFQLGLKAGANVSNFSGGDFGNIDKKALVGFHGGGFVSFLLGDNFAIQPEVLFSSQGAKLKNAGNEENFKVSYLNIPILAKYRFNGGFYLEAGPQIGFKVGENVPNNTINNFAKDLDLSLDAGLGFHSQSGFGIGGRYTAGLSKVGDFNTSAFNPDFKNGVVQLFVFVTLFNNNRD
ncbi:MAG TPA: porin family protein [Flavitalea sp.]|nr:porin family protein [Flavitalea sp.]